jgi:putative transcriptional regulator
MMDAVQRRCSSTPNIQSRRKMRSVAPSCAALLLFTAVLAALAEGVCKAEDKPADKPLFLVARPTILDPVFAKSVVLMLPLEGEPIIVGLIVNKPTKLQLVKLFPDSPSLKDSTEAAYLGGPVDPDTGALAFHAAKAPKQAMLLYDDVYLTFDSKLISKLLRDPKQTGDVRLFLGRAQWDPGQLQGEALEGSWYSLRAEGNIIFEHDSESLWKRMHARADPTHVENRLPRSPKLKVRGSTPALEPCSLSTKVNGARVAAGSRN